MKNRLLRILCLASLAGAISVRLMAQSSPIVLDPSQLEAPYSGYYWAGADVDENKDGTMEHHNKCYDAYGDQSFSEDSTQQDFTYANCMTMPTCWGKADSLASPTVSIGFIGIGKGKYFGTDSAHHCNIVSPAVTNLDSLYFELSGDLSSANMNIPYYIDYSTNNGSTWSIDDTINLIYIKDILGTQRKGKLITYRPDGTYPEFQGFVDASVAGPILIRISSGDNKGVGLGGDVGQRVFVHKIKIYAKAAPTAVKKVIVSSIKVSVYNGTVSASKGNVAVYAITGQLVGKGLKVTVSSGIYIVKTDDGIAQKVFVY